MALDIPFQALKIFLAVAETGSFTRAAERLNQPRYRVSRGVQQLESVMGVQLLHRTTRKTRLTEAGEQLLTEGQPLLAQLQQTLEKVSALTETVSGPLRLSAPEEFSQRILHAVLPQFQRLYPAVSFELLFGNDYVDLYKESVDFSLRIGELEDASLMQTQLGYVSIILVASPAYLKNSGIPQQVSDLNQEHKLLYFRNDNPKRESIFQDASRSLPGVSIHTISNRFSYLHTLALQGLGIATLPDFYVTEELQSGQLMRVLPEWVGGHRPVQMIYPALNPGGRKHVLFQQFMKTACLPLLS